MKKDYPNDIFLVVSGFHNKKTVFFQKLRNNEPIDTEIFFSISYNITKGIMLSYMKNYSNYGFSRVCSIHSYIYINNTTIFRFTYKYNLLGPARLFKFNFNCLARKCQVQNIFHRIP